MPYCPECGEEIGEDVQFCSNCGAPLKEETPAGRREPAKGVDVSDFINKPEWIMVVSGILMIIGSLGAWYTWGVGRVTFGWSVAGMRWATAFMGLVMIYSSVVEMGYIRILKDVVPVLSVSAVCGSVTLIGSLGALSSPLAGGWGLYVTLVASLIALFASVQAYSKIGIKLGSK